MNKQAITRPICAQLGPFAVDVTAGKKYIWCSCGRSKTQPWCDGSHIGASLEPITFIAPITAEFFIFGCKTPTTNLIVSAIAEATTLNAYKAMAHASQ